MSTKFIFPQNQGGPGSVRLRFGGGTVRAVPVFGSGGSSKEGVLNFCVSAQFSREDGPVPVSVPGKRFRRFRFRVRFLGKWFRRFRFPVPVRFLGHPAKWAKCVSLSLQYHQSGCTTGLDSRGCVLGSGVSVSFEGLMAENA